MVLRKEGIVKRTIYANDETFDIAKVYKGVKEKAEDLGYFFIEQEQAFKPGKYGDEVRFKFLFVKEVDFFGEQDISIEFNFENLSKVKGRDHGDYSIKIVGDVIIDYKNGWGMNSFNKFLLGLYAKVKDSEIKSKYIIPMIKDITEIQDYMKSEFGFYVS